MTYDLVENLFINVIWLLVEGHGNYNLNRFDFFLKILLGLVFMENVLSPFLHIYIIILL